MISFKSSLTAAYWEMFLFQIQNSNSEPEGRCKPFSFLNEIKVTLFFPSTRIQGILIWRSLVRALISDVLVLCWNSPLPVGKVWHCTFCGKSAESVPFLLCTDTAVHCPSVEPLRLKSCFVDWSTLVILFARALQISVLAKLRSRNKQPRGREGRLFPRRVSLPDGLFGEWWPVSSVPPNAGERHHYQTLTAPMQEHFWNPMTTLFPYKI